MGFIPRLHPPPLVLTKVLGQSQAFPPLPSPSISSESCAEALWLEDKTTARLQSKGTSAPTATRGQRQEGDSHKHESTQQSVTWVLPLQQCSEMCQSARHKHRDPTCLAEGNSLHASIKD